MATAVASAAEFRLAVGESVAPVDFEATLRAARAHRREHPDDTIVIALPAHLFRMAPIALGPEDSGRPGAPLVLRGDGAAGATITGAVEVESEALGRDEAMRAHLPPEVAARARRARPDEALLALTTPPFAAIGSFSPANPGRLIVFEGNRRLRPARWPSLGYFTEPALAPVQAPRALVVRPPAPVAGLADETNLWVDGFWGWNWWFERRKARARADGAIEIDKPEAPLHASARYRLVNVARGLDRSGVYYREPDGALDFLPEPDDRDARLFVAVATSLLKIKDAEHIRIENVAFEKTIGTAASIENSRDVVLSDCYVGEAGTNGVVIDGGEADRMENCVVDDVGYDGVSISGGDRASLTPSRHVLRGSYIARFGRELPTYRPGVSLQGVGASVEDCEIAFGPHAGLMFSGNDHRIEGNAFHDLVLDSEDVGAIYTGRNWTTRGVVIASNVFRDIADKVGASPADGVYLDDQISGATILANIFENVDRSVLVGGGRENTVRDNLFLRWRAGPVSVDGRGLTWQADMAKPGGALMKSLEAV
ncbi:MAG: right-handed parallel beta-helix repeat-containing protein, partial [Hyphomicrobiales bacterium]|nr:right-handed parallel beta-helix repeat-containing protein [Hyphomicrobiales bacterium]